MMKKDARRTGSTSVCNTAFNQIIGSTTIVNKRITEAFPGIRETIPEIFEIYGRVARTRKT